SVALRNVLHEPVNRVERVGRVIDDGGIQTTPQRTVHDIVAFRAVLAADILYNADVSAFDDHLGCIVIAAEDGTEMRALRMTGEDVGVVRRASEQDGRVLRASRYEDDGVKLDAVTHRNHLFAPDVVERVGGRLERRGSFSGEGVCPRRRHGILRGWNVQDDNRN